MTGRLRPAAPVLPLLLFLALASLLPVGLLLGGAIERSGPSAVGGALADPVNSAALGNSVLQGTLSAVAAVAVGYPIGVLLGRFDWPGQKLVRAVLTVPFVLPSLVVVEGVEALFAPGGILGDVPLAGSFARGLPAIVLVNVVFNVPIVALFTALGVESSDPALEESVRTLGAGPWQTYRTVWGPPSWGGAVAGGLLTFAFSAEAFAAPLLLCGPRCYTVEARVWQLSQLLLDPGTAQLLAIALVGTLFLPTLTFVVLTSRTGRGAGREPRPKPRLPFGSSWTWPLLAALAATLGTTIALLGAVLERAVLAPAPGGTPGSAWPELLSARVTGELGLGVGAVVANSLVFAAIASSLALLLGLLFAFPRRRAARSALRIATLAPLTVSPVVLAFALSSFWRPLLGGPSSVWALIIVSQTTLALPFALQSLDVAFGRLSPRLRESAQSLGAGPFTAYLESEVPMASEAIRTAGLFVFALGLGEFTATYFLATPSFRTIPVAIYQLQGLRETGASSALAGLLVLLSLATFWLLQRGGSRVLG